MKTETKKSLILSPLMRRHGGDKKVAARLVGMISKARAREWIRHVKKIRREWK